MATAPQKEVKIPFNQPWIDERELVAVEKVIHSGRIGGNGPLCRETEMALRKIFRVKHALLMTSCTHALETAVRVLGVSPGDQVIVPSFSFPSAANAVLLAGGEVVFAEISRETLNIDPEDLARKITGRTKAVILVHYAGVSCDMDRIMEITRERGLKVIEDAAQCICSAHRSRPLGSIGDAGCVSFHDTKNVVCGEGGAFLTNSGEILRKADIFREKGTNRSSFLRGEIDKYYWVDIGSSYVVTEIQAALLQVQLDKMEKINRKRAAVDDRYRSGLNDLVKQGKISLGKIPPECTANHHIFFLLIEKTDRDTCLIRLKEAGIGATAHFYPLHLSEMGRRLGYKEGDFPVTEEAFRKLIRLPIYPGLEDTQSDYIIETMHRILE